MFDNFAPLAAIATTPTGAKRLRSLFPPEVTVWVPESVTEIDGTRTYSGSLKDRIASLWSSHRALVFCLATGAVVRLIAPLLQHKSTDPAVVVVDETGKFAVSLCSGHQGGADRLTDAIARQLGATPVITGSSACQGLPGIDILGIPFGWRRGSGDWTGVSAVIARGEPVEVMQEVGSTLWQDRLPAGHPFRFGLDDLEERDARERASTAKARIWIGYTQRRFAPDSEFPKVQWHPRVLWVGIGCERGTSRRVIEAAIARVFAANHLAQEAIAGIATIDIKADETGLLQLCDDRAFPLVTFDRDRLKSVWVPTPSDTVSREVGTPSVAEAAAILASGTSDSLLVSKQIFRLEDEPGAVTVAVAHSSVEYTSRQGKLWLVGTGPGRLELMTPAAQSAIAQADAVIGYSLYLDLISPLLRPAQIVESSPITQERQRASRAIALAQWGLTVAVVSSGDCGIYGMAGLVMEQLQQGNWDGKTPAVQVFPGISALQSAASRVGVPLMHDFCAISLSDLLTPREVIEQRLKAAAAADFIVALYNPRSRTRTEPLEIAHSIFLQHRDPETPVAIARSVYRDNEEIVLTTLDKMLDCEIDMLTTVIIGNRSTTVYANWMITPRGYCGFGT